MKTEKVLKFSISFFSMKSKLLLSSARAKYIYKFSATSCYVHTIIICMCKWKMGKNKKKNASTLR